MPIVDRYTTDTVHWYITDTLPTTLSRPTVGWSVDQYSTDIPTSLSTEMSSAMSSDIRYKTHDPSYISLFSTRWYIDLARVKSEALVETFKKSLSKVKFSKPGIIFTVHELVLPFCIPYDFMVWTPSCTGLAHFTSISCLQFFSLGSWYLFCDTRSQMNVGDFLFTTGLFIVFPAVFNSVFLS